MYGRDRSTISPHTASTKRGPSYGPRKAGTTTSIGQLEHVGRSIAADELCNHFVPREDGSPLLVVMLYGRGLGPARLLIPDLFDDIFPEGYRVAVPEMTCAVAHTTVTSTSEAQKIAEVIEGLYRVGTEPISPESFDPQLFWDMAPEDAGAR